MPGHGPPLLSRYHAARTICYDCMHSAAAQWLRCCLIAASSHRCYFVPLLGYDQRQPLTASPLWAHDDVSRGGRFAYGAPRPLPRGHFPVRRCHISVVSLSSARARPGGPRRRRVACRVRHFSIYVCAVCVCSAACAFVGRSGSAADRAQRLRCAGVVAAAGSNYIA